MNHRTKAEWTEVIRAAWNGTVLGIIECGAAVKQCKFELFHGEFEEMVQKDLPFSTRTARCLRRISEDERLRHNCAVLPPYWRTIYALTTLGNDEFDEGLADKTINPEMKLSDVGKLKRLNGRTGYEEEITDGCTVEDLDQLITAGKKFSVIYADPPWEFKVYSGKGKQRSADRHYNTQSLDDIKNLPVEKLAQDDCALLLWAVMPELPGALSVIEAWGFTYKTVGFTWVKQVSIENKNLAWGMGYWTRANAELCLLATKGSPKRQAMDVHQVIMSPVGEHSRKPDEAQLRIERLLLGPYIELFGRRAVPNWTVWGNQISRSLFHKDIPEFAA